VAGVVAVTTFSSGLIGNTEKETEMPSVLDEIDNRNANVEYQVNPTTFYEANLTPEQSLLLKTLASYGYETTYEGAFTFDVTDPESVSNDVIEIFMVANNVGFSPQDMEKF